MVLAVLSAVFLGLYDVAKKASVQDNAVLPVLLACSASGLLVFLPVVARCRHAGGCGQRALR